MIDTLTFELCLKRLSFFGNRPNILGPTIAFLVAERASPQPSS